MGRRWPTRSAKTGWIIYGCNRWTARVADRSPILIRSRFSTSVGHRMAKASPSSAAIPTPTLSSSENRLNSPEPDIKIHTTLGDRPHLSIHQETRNVNPRHLATLSLFLLFVLDGTSRRSASPQTAQRFDAKLFQELRWRTIGPFRGGRTLAVTGVRGQPEIFYFGSVGGGVWKTNDAGRTWNPIFDSQAIASIGAIAVAPSDSNVIYVGSGGADMRSSISYGDGMYKSTDGGKTWAHIGLSDSRQIGRLLVEPRDPNRVFVAALGHAYGPNQERGVYRSKDGGKNWQRILFHDENTGAIDLALEPGNSKTIYAALWQTRRAPWSIYPPSNGPGSGLYSSNDGGDHWG